MGRKIGFPTANLVPVLPNKLIPGNGVYIVQVEKDGDNRKYKGMMNIGNRPTFGYHGRSIEVHILEFGEEIYGSQLTITVFEKIREEIKFENAEALKLQLSNDLTITKDYAFESFS